MTNIFISKIASLCLLCFSKKRNC